MRAPSPSSGPEAASAAHAPAQSGGRLSIPFVEFVALMAALVALTAACIDIMLPALPEIAAWYGVAEENQRQLVVSSYLLGFAGGQLFIGPLSDRYGRKPILVLGLGLFVIATVLAVVAPSFELLLAARLVQGIGGSAPRIVSIAVVRDLFAGRPMARVMSFVMMVFIVVPVVAPSVGVGLLAVGDWRWGFYVLLAIGAVLIAWTALRLPETRPRDARLPLTLRSLGDAFRSTLSNRQTLGYMVAQGLMLGSLMTYITSAQQIFVDLYDLGDGFAIAFGAIASVLAVASFTSARLVGRHGMRRVSHSGLLGYIAASVLLVAVALGGLPPLLLFCGLVAAALFMFGLILPNFNALAMEPHGRIAGTASSCIGFFVSMSSAVLGTYVGQSFDGTVMPLALGFLVFGTLGLCVVLATEGRRGLFHAGQ